MGADGEVFGVLEEPLAGGILPQAVGEAGHDSHILNVELTYRDEIVGALTLSRGGDDEKAIAFAVRPQNTELAAYLDGFVKKTYRGLEYNSGWIPIAGLATSRTQFLYGQDPPVCMIGGFTSDLDVGSPEWLLQTRGDHRSARRAPAASVHIGSLGGRSQGRTERWRDG